MPKDANEFPELIWVASGDGQVIHACIRYWSMADNTIHIDDVDNPTHGLVDYWTTPKFIYRTREEAVKAAVENLRKAIARQLEENERGVKRLDELRRRLENFENEIERKT